jgi:hypothetical protein
MARRFAGGLSIRVAVLLALLPLVFTGEAMLTGKLYGPADLYANWPPFTRAAGEPAVEGRNPILSDVAFANLPWRAAVRDSIANGRMPFWNRFVLGGTPLLAAAQAAVFHPSTWAGILLPLPLSWTFSCTFTLFLGLLSAYVWLRDFDLPGASSLVGAIGWGFSTYLVFWNGWSVGPATASLPLLLLGVRRMARGGPHGIGLSVAGFLLGFFGGHPETTLHASLVAAVYFAWELAGTRRGIGRALASAAGAAVLAFLLGAPQLFPLAEAVRNSAEYRARSAIGAGGRQSVPASQAAARALPAALPFAHGIYGKSPVQERRSDGSGMPLAYAGALLFPLAGLALFSRRFPVRGRSWFAAAALVGLLMGTSAPGLMDLMTRWPGFAMTLNYRLVFLVGLGLSGLAAFGTEEARRGAPLALACLATAGVLVVTVIAAREVLRDRALPRDFVVASFAREVLPLVLLAAAAGILARRPAALAGGTVLLLVCQRGLEMAGTYPTLPRDAMAPVFAGLPTLASAAPDRIVGAGDAIRPNVAALYGLEDVRGYESLVLARFADTEPLWSEPQSQSFNRVDRLDRPFLSFLGARLAAARGDEPVAPGWSPLSRSAALAIFENPSALPRAFVPRRIRRLVPLAVLGEMRRASDFRTLAWVDSERSSGEVSNPRDSTVRMRESGNDLVLSVSSPTAPVLVATSLPDWPGWMARTPAGTLPTVTVNHAFVGFWAPAGETSVRVSYAPRSWPYALGALALGVVASAVRALSR